MPRYGPDLAWIHHAGFGGFSRGAAPGLLATLGAAGLRGGHVVDLGCGSGLWLRALARAGCRATGVDRSAAMLRLARTVAPRAALIRSAVQAAALPPCDAVTALGEVLGYLPPSGRGAPALAAVVRHASRALGPGGLLIFDLIVSGRPALTYRTWRQGPGWAVLLDVQEDGARRRVTRLITTFRRGPGGWRRGVERHVLEVFDRTAVTRLLRAAGFTVRTARAYGAMALPPRRLVFVARRRR